MSNNLKKSIIKVKNRNELSKMNRIYGQIYKFEESHFMRDDKCEYVINYGDVLHLIDIRN